MTKIVPLQAHDKSWNAHACLHCAIEETDADDQVIVIVRKKDGARHKYIANYNNMEVYWEAGILQEDALEAAKG